jgi:EAL domain-containing protein (putative c-di-GMP-specific phosphodiesterase class I)
MSTNTLLILDDDDQLASLIMEEAIRLDFEVKHCTDGRQFMDTFIAWKPSHVAIDLVMPSIDGIETLKMLARLDCRSSIILTSGIGSAMLPLAQITALEHELNICGILHQPFLPHLLQKLLANHPSVDLHAPHSEHAASTLTIDQVSLEQAIAQQQLKVFYQPQIELFTGEVMGFEALLRWQHPQYGIQLPEAFIHVAEQTGQIEALTEYVIVAGIQFIQSISSTLTLSVNISAKSLHNDRLIAMLEQACQRFAFDPSRMILELTETATMLDTKHAEQILGHLREQGFKLSIDDFGTGYSSMAQLANLPFTELKIDKSFVMTMENSSKSRKVIASTLKLAESLGLETIAEGIENSMAAIGLRELGCRYGQGYFFARPMDETASRVWLMHWNTQR